MTVNNNIRVKRIFFIAAHSIPDRVEMPLKKSVFLHYNDVFFSNIFAPVMAYHIHSKFFGPAGLRSAGDVAQLLRTANG